jgi:hypothetical protein
VLGRGSAFWNGFLSQDTSCHAGMIKCWHAPSVVPARVPCWHGGVCPETRLRVSTDTAVLAHATCGHSREYAETRVVRARGRPC